MQRLSAGQNAVLTKWLCRRSDTPTVLLSRRKLGTWGGEPIVHAPPRSWPLKLAHASDGYRDWQRLTKLIDCRPGGMTLARAVVPLTGSREFHRILNEGDELVEEVGHNEVLRLLARTVAERAPMAWRRVLTLVGELDGASVGAIESVVDADDRPALASLRRIHLVEERSGRLTVLPLLRDFAGVALEPGNRDELLGKAAHYLLTRVNDPQTLDPLEADSVFRAHTLFVRGGDFTNARRTARLHAGGLISLAKRTSLNRDWAEARRLYDSILELLEHNRTEPVSVHGRHTESYVVHYRGYNDERVNRSSSVQALNDYTRSIDLWSENALWRQHQIEAFIHRGHVRDAKDSIDRAYAGVGEHPRRDTLLRVRPARTALRRGAPVFALEIIEGVDITFEQDPDGADLLTQIENEWADGISVPSLPRTEGELIFRRPVTVSVQNRGQGWRAQFHDFHGKPGRGQTALAALRHLADQLGDEAHALLSTPSHLLEDDDVARKSEIIAHLDPLNSDIGLAHAGHRWLMGRIENGEFVPLQRTDFDPIPLPSEVRGNHGEHGEYMAKVQVYRDGDPKVRSSTCDRRGAVGCWRSCSPN